MYGDEIKKQIEEAFNIENKALKEKNYKRFESTQNIRFQKEEKLSGYKMAQKEELEFLKKLRKILNEYHSAIPEVEIGRQNVLNDVDNELKLDERIKQLSKEDGRI